MSNPHSNEKSIPDLHRYPLEQIGSAEKRARVPESSVGPDYFSILEEQATRQLEMTASIGAKTAVLITNTGIGQGEHQLGSMLMNQFFFSLTRLEEVVRCILFINSGVFLVTEGSDILPHLRVLQERGVEIIISSACLEHYQLTDKIQIGSMANMFTITEKLMDSLRVITL
ncbi:MAG: sulfurtransferase-like selenium metabolism protein YedF [Syntrophomonadaceae bacterium]|jgi:selenium metabolism protein YedF|nr:sulfurtransferase-like selenium metabolism protein YedF [Syntrophomonadaceae bacterium]HQD90370.1 sulfurtransferase-like selenium metabolism protein YedF [Syntrophomonadaceae bacterium]